LEIAVYRIRKVDVFISEVDRNVIERVELAAKIIVDKDLEGRPPVKTRTVVELLECWHNTH
jgi:hypothetical protein